jgi:hypothetical protein
MIKTSKDKEHYLLKIFSFQNLSVDMTEITVTSIFKNKSYQTISTHLFYKITNYSVVKIFHMYPLNTLKIK